MSIPTNPNSPEPKKGMSGLAMAGIGCGGLFIVIGVAGFLLLGKACSKIKEVASEMEKNPSAMVTMALKLNPEIEVISTDDAKREVTFKVKKTGKVTTMSFDDIKNGKFKMTTDGQEVVIDGSEVTKTGQVKMKDSKGNEVTVNSGNGGILHSKGPDGEMTLGGATTAPAWVPAYPGAKALEGSMMMVKETETTGMSVAESTDSVEKVKSFYESKLKEAGYTVEANVLSVDEKNNAVVRGTKGDGKSTISVMISTEDGKTRMLINYQEKK